MGSVCISSSPLEKPDKPAYTRQSIHIQAQQSNQHIDFNFTTEKLIHINSDLLIIFLDHSINIRKNDHFIKLPLQAAKLEEFGKAKLQKNKGESYVENQQKKGYVTFSIMIPTLNYKYVSLIFCDIWLDDKEFIQSFGNLLANYFHSVDNLQSKSIVISEFTSELGIPLQGGMRAVVNELLRVQNRPQKIQFCCLNEDSKNLLSELIDQNKEALTKSFASSGSIASNYI